MKNHIVEELKSAGMSGVEAEHAFNEVTQAMARVVRRGKRVRIHGIGILTKRDRQETKKHNPQTGESMTIAAHKVVVIRNPEKF